MRRLSPPFNGKRFLLNLHTGEIHDLDCETESCHIDSIALDHIYMADSYDEALVHAVMVERRQPNGCHYCIPSKDIG